MDKIRALLKDVFSTETLRYMTVGAVSGLSNVIIYFFMKDVLDINYLVSNAFSLTVTVIFSYVLNKIYVFKIKHKNFKEAFKNFLSFTGSRIFGSLTDMLILYILVDRFKMSSSISKFIDSAIVSVLNYLLCKLLVFK